MRTSSMINWIGSATLAAIFGASVWAADPVSIGQKGRKFSQDAVTVEAGQAIVFVNDDRVPHNIYTKVGSQRIDKGLSRPGQDTELVFDEAGEYLVSCAIHPKMKIAVTVK